MKLFLFLMVIRLKKSKQYFHLPGHLSQKIKTKLNFKLQLAVSQIMRWGMQILTPQVSPKLNKQVNTRVKASLSIKLQMELLQIKNKHKDKVDYLKIRNLQTEP